MPDYEYIVSNVDSPTLVLAGPGAGKTYLLGGRVKRLLDQGVSKRSITVVAFGRDASQHMRNKLLDPVGGFNIPFDNLPNISTLHSLAFEIVKQKPRTVGLRKTGLKVLRDEEVKRLLYRDASLILGHTEEESSKALKCKQHGDCDIGSKDIECAICLKYWELMSNCNYVDFDDQVLFACQILEKESEILARYQTRSEHLLVDEYQDINAAAFRLIDLLSRSSRNGLFAVGDDAQAIYGFRGADTRFILQFEKDFPGAFKPPLQHSRRCHENTMNDASAVLKTFYSEWTGPYELEYHVQNGELPRIWQLPSEIKEAHWVARIARDAVSKKKSVLVLAPKKDFFPLISDKLNSYGIPHVSPVNLLSEETNKRLNVIRRVLDWVKNPDSSFATRVVAETLIDNGTARVACARKDKRCKPETIEKRRQVETEIAQLWEKVDKKTTLWEVIRSEKFLSEPLQLLRESMCGLSETYDSREEHMREGFAKHLAVTSGVWKQPETLAKDMCSVIDLLNAPKPTGFGGIQLMTMKKAKGLEADVVVMVGLEDDIMPNPISDQEEEARLFYVSMTRAKEKLYLFHSYKRPRKVSFGSDLTDKKRSRFLDALGRDSKYIRDRAKTE